MVWRFRLNQDQPGFVPVQTSSGLMRMILNARTLEDFYALV
jgi:hypothetical protein